ncbi:class I SAM-dependent methyltransferase [Fredinandcohnia sp. 179-A 10B2 NHS]|uniref:class I SAM-dependent methyltransferase n=1 Tax=Fredinandcohnia sp. 179-A 10B2 NHS TaxID=3235176 RepID=UPI0039A16F6C
MEILNEKKNLEEYDNPELYDKENNPYIDDVKFLMKWAQKKGGPIIDLACGTGRATIPLAEKGFELLGVDIHTGMLELARKKTDGKNLPVSWVEQDCTKLDLGIKSPFIYMVGNSFQHFLTNEVQNQLLTSIRNHLEENGVFVFGTRFPSADELLQPPTEEYWKSYRDEETGRIVDVSTINNYDSLTQVQHYITIRRSKDENGNIVSETKSNIALRYVFPQEMKRLLNENGLEVLEIYRDWNENPLTSDSYQMIYVCQKK